MKELIKKQNYVQYFQDLEKSKEVVRLQNKSLVFAATAGEYFGDEIPVFIRQVRQLKREADKERAVINDRLKEIKNLNQGIYQTIIDKLKALEKVKQSEYNEYLKETERRARELQAQLDREAEEKRKKLEEERRVAEENNLPAPPPVIVPAPQVKPIEIVKTVARKSIDVEIINEIAFIQHAITTKDPELLDCISITKTTGIRNKAERNPGKVDIPGTSIAYNPTPGAWGIKT